MRSRLESQGVNVDQVNLIEDLDTLNVTLDDDEQEHTTKQTGPSNYPIPPSHLPIPTLPPFPV